MKQTDQDHPTKAEVAQDYQLFEEFVDRDGLVTLDEFEATDEATRESWLDDAGWEDPIICACGARVYEHDAENTGWRWDGQQWQCPTCQATAAARALRAIPSAARTEASRANGRKGGRPRQPRYVVVNTFTPGHDGYGTVVGVHRSLEAAVARERQVQPRERGSYLPTVIVRTDERVTRGDTVQWRRYEDVGEAIDALRRGL